MSSMLQSEEQAIVTPVPQSEGGRVNIKKLIEEHERISASTHRVRALLRDPAPDVKAAWNGLRLLSVELVSHLAYEDGFIFPMLVDMEKEQARLAADAFIAEFAALRDDWSAHMRKWNNDDRLFAEWESFADTTEALLIRLDRRVKRENEILYPLAFRHGFLEFRDLAPRITTSR